LPKPLDLNAISETQQSDPETIQLTKTISSLQLRNLPLPDSNNTILCDILQGEPV